MSNLSELKQEADENISDNKLLISTVTLENVKEAVKLSFEHLENVFSIDI